jgi:hypothetical protein
MGLPLRPSCASPFTPTHPPTHASPSPSAARHPQTHASTTLLLAQL